MISTKWPPHSDKKKLKGDDVSHLSLVEHYLPRFLEVLAETGVCVCVCGWVHVGVVCRCV